MTLVHVVPHITDEASGPSYSVPRLCQSLAARGHFVELSCLAAGKDVPGVRVDVHPQWRFPSRLAVSPSHTRALRVEADRVDVVHNHSLWSMVNIAAGWAVPGRRAKLVVSPRGTLSAWALGRRRVAKSVLWYAQRRVLVRADLLHATSEGEYREFREIGLTAPVAIVPNGIDVPDATVARPPARESRLLFLGRIHPTKGMEALLSAWASLQATHPDWSLVVAGVGDPRYEAQIKRTAVDSGLERVTFAGPLYGAAKSQAYFEAELFVLPSHSENFGMAVAEALAHGCPAIVSQAAPWAGLEREGCGWWVQNTVDALTHALDSAMRLPSDRLAAMGHQGRRWMERDFSWPSIAEQLESAYRWLLQGGQRPSCVRVD